MSRTAIIILNWNCPDDSITCAESLDQQIADTLDIVFVDNASSDNSLELLQAYTEARPNTHLIANPINSGYTGGNNVGFEYALEKSYEYIGTLNPDAIADKAWVTELISQLDTDETIGIATGLLARSDREHLDSTGDFYTIWGLPAPRGRNQTIETAPGAPEFVFGSSGGGFIARASALRATGLFDERYFMYYEDVDLSFRMQLAGYKVRYTPNAIAYHKISVSTDKVPGLATTHTFKNLPMLFTKNVPLGLWPKILPRFTLTYTLILANAIVRGRGIPAIKGWMMSWLLTPHMFSERWRIQRSRKVSTGYINSIILHDIPEDQTGLRKLKRLLPFIK